MDMQRSEGIPGVLYSDSSYLAQATIMLLYV